MALASDYIESLSSKRVVGLATSHQLCALTAVQYEMKDRGFILSTLTGVSKIVLIKAYFQIFFWWGAGLHPTISNSFDILIRACHFLAL